VRTRTKLRRTAGYVVVGLAVSSFALIGFLGFAIDIGYLRSVQSRMQTAADAAALAGALELARGRADATGAAKEDAALNGFRDGENRTAVQIHTPPRRGALRSHAGAVEAVVSQPVRPFFMSALGFSTVTVAARAVALPAQKSGRGVVLGE